MPHLFPLVFHSQSEEQTLGFAQALAPLLRSGDVLALEGELGAGKTVFVRGVARGLGISQPVRSPGFLIISPLKGRLELFHVDAYRLSHPNELLEVGFQEILEADGVVAIEWADKVAPLLPPRRLQVRLKHLDPGREIQIKDLGLDLEQRPGAQALANPCD